VACDASSRRGARAKEKILEAVFGMFAEMGYRDAIRSEIFRPCISHAHYIDLSYCT